MQTRRSDDTIKNKKKIEIQYEELHDIKIKKLKEQPERSYEKNKENQNLQKKSLSVGKSDVKAKYKFDEKTLEKDICSDTDKIKIHNKSKSLIIKDFNKSKSEQIKPPKDFEKIWNIIKSMREAKQAPNDQMDEEWAYFFDPKREERTIHKFQMLVFSLLSSLTKGKINLQASMRLVNHGLTVDNILETDEEKIKELIRGCAFVNNKTKFLKKIATIIKDKYNYDPPEDLQEVLKLPGIGPKMAYVYLELGCKKREGMIVDTHVHRITNRLKWVSNTKTPEETRVQLESWLPKEKWVDLNLMLVAFGQTICQAPYPKCHECKLNKTCEFGINRLKEINLKNLKNNNSKLKSRKNTKEKISQEYDQQDNIKTSFIKRKPDNILEVNKKRKK